MTSRKVIRRGLKIITWILIALVSIFALIFLFITFYPSIGQCPTRAMQAQYAKRTPYYVDGRFQNVNEYSRMSGNKSESRGDSVHPTGQIPVIKRGSIPPASKTEPAITWLGHSSLLIQKGGMNILIDPVFSRNASPVPFAGPRRFSEIPITPENLPHIDVVLISHGHYDHLDYNSIRQIDEKVGQYLVPLGVESYLMGWGVDESKITNMAWWEDVNINDVRFSLVPALHWAIRNPFRGGQTLWGGFVLDDGQYTSYFTGDSGYDEDIFSEIFIRYGVIDLFFSDTGQYNVRWPQSHMNPEQAFKAAEDVHAKWVMPIHWGAFVISDHNWDDPPQLLIEQAEDSTINIITPHIGETVLYSEIEKYQQRWWEGVE